jgi:predicted phage replisome organizer
MAKKYYWLKLQKDFFKRHDIRIIEDMPNGKDYILFYMKLLVESIGHEGKLRFSETIPYNDSMLATITNTNIDIVRSAVKIFNELDLMNVMDDGTLFLSETSNMLGSVTDWAEKKRVYREKQKQIGQKEDMSDKSKSIELEKELDLDIEKDYKGDFQKFYEAYPKKKSKGDAEKAFKKVAALLPPIEELVSIVEKWKETADWKKDGGQFIPYPGSWLRAYGWEDEIPKETIKLEPFNLKTCTEETRNKYMPFIREYNRDPKNNMELEEYKGVEK